MSRVGNRNLRSFHLIISFPSNYLTVAGNCGRSQYQGDNRTRTAWPDYRRLTSRGRPGRLLHTVAGPDLFGPREHGLSATVSFLCKDTFLSQKLRVRNGRSWHLEMLPLDHSKVSVLLRIAGIWRLI